MLQCVIIEDVFEMILVRSALKARRNEITNFTRILEDDLRKYREEFV